MANNPEIVEWIATAPGLMLNPDRAYGNQCVDAVDAYGEAIFAVPWPVCVGGVAGAKALLDRVPDEFWIRTDNDPNNPALIPSNGDVVVFAGIPGVNDWGHTAIVDSADQNGMWVVQQDGFAEPRIFVDGGWYSNKPAHRAWLPYWGPGTGMVAGWLTPRPEKIVGYVPPSTHVTPGPMQRCTVVDSHVGYRTAPAVDAELIKWLDPDTVYDFKGYVRANDKTWFVGAYTGGFAWVGGFTDEGTHDLPDLTDLLVPGVPVIVPPVQPPDVRLTQEAHLNMIDVSNHNEDANLAEVPADMVWVKASEGVGWVDPALASNVAEARADGRPVGFYHFARFGAQAGNTAEAELETFLAAIKPYAQIGDGIALDNEAEGTSNVGACKEWLDGARAATGATGLIYLNHGAIMAADGGAGWQPVEVDYPLWFAGGSIYGEITVGYKPREAADALVGWASGLRMWQYTGRGRLGSYTRDLDLNVFYGTREDVKRLGIQRLQVDPEPPAKQVPALTDPISKLVEYYQE